MMSEKSSGFVKLHRKLSRNPIWTLEPFTKGQAWVDLFMIANHSPGKIDVRGNIIDIERGQVGWSILKLSERWKWSRSKVVKFLNYLEKEQQIVQHKNSISSIVSIVNYDEYQEKDSKKSSKETTEEQQKDTNKNDKKKKKENIPPSLDEVAGYCQERKNNIDPQRFIDHYSATGWMRGNNKIKSWKACVRTWEGNNKNNNAQPQASSITDGMSSGQLEALRKLQEGL